MEAKISEWIGPEVTQTGSRTGSRSACWRDWLVVTDDHYTPRIHAGLACSSTVTGSVNAKVEPLPGLDSTQMRPPCISIIRFEMARPSPVPPFFRVIELSAC